MANRELVKVCVLGNEVSFHSQDPGVITWIETLIKENPLRLKGLDVGRPTGEVLCIVGFEEHRQAINYASWLIKQLLEHGWQHYSLSNYTDGHWFVKGS